MITAYCLHTSEGVPVRRIMETKVTDASIQVTVTDCDWDWNRKQRVQTFGFAIKPKPWYISSSNWREWNAKSEDKYHKDFRRQMNHQHNWRFEVYWPLSSLVN